VKTAIISACALAGTLLVGAAAAQESKMPPETAAYRASDLPGYALAQRHCLMCHSAHYVTTQPPTSSRAYWDATVTKMKKPFGAPFPDEDIPALVDYLVRTYGAERAGTR
jgi:sulfite dehydrogenase